MFHLEKRDHFLVTLRPVLSKTEQVVQPCYREGPTGCQQEADLSIAWERPARPKDVLRIRAVCLYERGISSPWKYVSRSSKTSCQRCCRWGVGMGPDLRIPSDPKILGYLLQSQIQFFVFLSRLELFRDDCFVPLNTLKNDFHSFKREHFRSWGAKKPSIFSIVLAYPPYQCYPQRLC